MSNTYDVTNKIDVLQGRIKMLASFYFYHHLPKEYIFKINQNIDFEYFEIPAFVKFKLFGLPQHIYKIKGKFYEQQNKQILQLRFYPNFLALFLIYVGLLFFFILFLEENSFLFSLMVIISVQCLLVILYLISKRKAFHKMEELLHLNVEN